MRSLSFILRKMARFTSSFRVLHVSPPRRGYLSRTRGHSKLLARVGTCGRLRRGDLRRCWRLEHWSIFRPLELVMVRLRLICFLGDCLLGSLPVGWAVYRHFLEVRLLRLGRRRTLTRGSFCRILLQVCGHYLALLFCTLVFRPFLSLLVVSYCRRFRLSLRSHLSILRILMGGRDVWQGLR